MAEDETGWSEKGRAKRSGKDDSPKDDSPKDDVEGSATPTRPSKRDGGSRGTSEGESSIVRTPSSDGAKKVAKAAATAGQRDVSFASRLGFPALVAAVCLAGIITVYFAWAGRDALATPVQNLDHWHAVYGVYNCNAIGDGDAKYLPAFQSTQDDTGIHSHGDGLMHIHPFFELSSGQNAQVRHWLSEMNVEITPERISVQNQFDAPVELVAGEECADGTGTAEIKVLHWDFDFEILNDDRPDPNIILSDFGDIKYEHDREVYIFAYIGENTDISEIPIPPSDRFDTLNNVSSQIQYEPTTLNPQDTGTSTDDGDATSTDGADASADDAADE